MTIVYGSAYHDMSTDIIAELSRKYMYFVLPLVFGGDFNLVRRTSEKIIGRLIKI
jgi:hypothetical protein